MSALPEREAQQYYNSPYFAKAKLYNNGGQSIISVFCTRAAHVKVYQYLQSLTLNSNLKKDSNGLDEALNTSVVLSLSSVLKNRMHTET